MRAERALPRVPSSLVTSIVLSWRFGQASQPVNYRANHADPAQSRPLHIFTIIKRLSASAFLPFWQSCGSKQQVNVHSHI
jgi:hypothetical protein